MAKLLSRYLLPTIHYTAGSSNNSECFARKEEVFHQDRGFNEVNQIFQMGVKPVGEGLLGLWDDGYTPTVFLKFDPGLNFRIHGTSSVD